jgi:aerobic C4-dicarboxylate transport protein
MNPTALAGRGIESAALPSHTLRAFNERLPIHRATNTPLTIEQQLGLLAVLLLASKGAAGVAGAAFVVLAATLASVGSIPVESVALILGVHRLLSEGLTPTNLIGNGVATIVVAKWENALDENRLKQVLNREIDPAGLPDAVPL